MQWASSMAMRSVTLTDDVFEGGKILKKREQAIDDYEKRCPLGWTLDQTTIDLILADPLKNDMACSHTFNNDYLCVSIDSWIGAGRFASAFCEAHPGGDAFSCQTE